MSPTKRVRRPQPTAVEQQDTSLVADQTRNSKNLSIRMYEDEYQALLATCEALSTPDVKVEPSLLLTTAAVEEAARLGFTPSTAGSSVRRRPGTWENSPPVRDESYKRRITITIHPLHFHAIRSAAEWAGAEVPRFLLGSMWRFISNRQRAERGNAKLRDIEVPVKYRESQEPPRGR